MLPPLVLVAAILLMPGRPAPAESSVPTIRLRDFVGVNAVVNNDPDDIAQVAGWVRDYHKWYWYEDADDAYNWATGSSRLRQPARLEAFYGALRAAGVSIMPVVEFAPGWASSDGTIRGTPNAEKHAEYLAALVRHFGDTLAAIENFNEPNQWWNPPRFPAPQFGAMTARDYAAVKAVNPELPFILGGLAGPDVGYLSEVARASDGQFDVVNFHWYAEGDGRRGGKNPESGDLRRSIERMSSWRSANARGKAVWITELGWDTYAPPGGSSSKIYAPEDAAANYLLRALFIMQAQGVEKVFVFNYRDPGGDESQIEALYSSAGLVENDSERDGRKKPGWFFLATLKSVLGEYALEQVVSDGPQIYRYEYVIPGTDSRAAVMWARDGDRDRGFTADYRGPAGTLVVPVDGSTTGEVSQTDGWVQLSETPIMVLYTGRRPAITAPPAAPAATAAPVLKPSTDAGAAGKTGVASAPSEPATSAQVPRSPLDGGAAAADRLLNGGFEGGAEGWQIPSWYTNVAAVNSALARSGSSALRFSGKDGIGPYAFQEVEAKPGEVVRFSGWVNVVEQSGGGALVVELVARHSQNGEMATYPLASLADTTDGWTEIVGSAVMPERTASVRLQIRFPKLNGTVAFDDFSLTVGAPR